MSPREKLIKTGANSVVRPIHAKAMPVMLTGSIDEAVALQRPLPAEQLRIVAKGAKTDG